MKKWGRSLGILFLASIYLLGIGAGNEHAFSTPKNVFGQDSGHETIVSPTKVTFLCQAPKQESFVDHVNDLPFPQNTLFFTALFGAQRPHNILFAAKARQYLGASITFLVRHRKADLIFPFHSSWLCFRTSFLKADPIWIRRVLCAQDPVQLSIHYQNKKDGNRFWDPDHRGLDSGRMCHPLCVDHRGQKKEGETDDAFTCRHGGTAPMPSGPARVLWQLCPCRG